MRAFFRAHAAPSGGGTRWPSDWLEYRDAIAVPCTDHAVGPIGLL